MYCTCINVDVTKQREEWHYIDLTLLARIYEITASICLGEYNQSSVYLEHLFIAQLDDGVYETLATIRYPQKCTSAE